MSTTPQSSAIEVYKQPHVSSLTPPEWARAIDNRIREIVNGAKKDFIECGILVRDIEENLLWAHLDNPATGLPYQSFPEWANNVLGYGRATYMEAKRVVKEFPDIPIETLQDIPRCNFKHLRLLPESKRTKKEWIAAAKGPEKEFVAKMKKDVPDLHVEHKQRLIFALYESSLNVIDRALTAKMEQMKQDSPDVTKEEALEHICAEWLEAN